MGRLDGKVAIVTGAGSGIGEATARLLAREGAKVVATGRKRDVLEQIVAEIRAEGFEATAEPHDVSLEADWQAVTARAVALYGTVNILANVAAKADEDPFDTPETITEAEWDLILDTNTKSIFWGAKYVIPIMKAAGGGSIINVASISTVLGSVSGFAYSASKGGVAGMTKDIAWHYGPDNIRCNSVHPGPTDGQSRCCQTHHRRHSAAPRMRSDPAGLRHPVSGVRRSRFRYRHHIGDRWRVLHQLNTHFGMEISHERF